MRFLSAFFHFKWQKSRTMASCSDVTRPKWLPAVAEVMRVMRIKRKDRKALGITQ